MLFNEPKLLKFRSAPRRVRSQRGFSALQRAEIAEMPVLRPLPHLVARFSALQRAEIAEIDIAQTRDLALSRFQCSSTSRNC